MKKSIFAVLCICQALLSFNASADLIFPLWSDGTETVAEEMIFADGDVSLSVTAWTSSYNSDGDQLEDWMQVTGSGLGVYQDENGLGVISSVDDGNDLDGGSSSNYLDDPDEGLLFLFSEVVNIFDIFMGDLDSSDDFNISVVDFLSPTEIVLSQTETDIFGPPFETEFPFIFDGEFRGSAFMVWVDGGSDDVEVLGISTIPEPGVLMLFALGLLSLSASRRRF